MEEEMSYEEKVEEQFEKDEESAKETVRGYTEEEFKIHDFAVNMCVNWVKYYRECGGDNDLRSVRDSLYHYISKDIKKL